MIFEPEIVIKEEPEVIIKEEDEEWNDETHPSNSLISEEVPCRSNEDVAEEVKEIENKEHANVGTKSIDDVDDHSNFEKITSTKDGEVFQNIVLPLLCEDSLPVINWMKNNGLLNRQMICRICKEEMKLMKYSKSKDGLAWRCHIKNCPKFNLTVSIRTGSFFANSNMRLQTWIHAIYLWTENVGEKSASKQLNISERTMVDCFSLFRKICLNYFKSNPISLGGPGIVVEANESCFFHKPKHHRGRSSNSSMWIFGLVDTSVTPAVGYMQIVERRDAATLLPIIKRVVNPGTIIHIDEWKSYQNIQTLGFDQKTVNPSVNFVEPVTGVHKQQIESYWSKHKSKIKKMHGCRRDMLNSYIHEFMWRDRFSLYGFENLCRHIALQYPQ